MLKSLIKVLGVLILMLRAGIILKPYKDINTPLKRADSLNVLQNVFLMTRIFLQVYIQTKLKTRKIFLSM